MIEPTPSQTVGPFFHGGLLWGIHEPPCGEHIRIAGYVRDGDGAPVPDALIELWQANAHGRYNHPADARALPLDASFTGFARAATDAAGAYCFETIRPGAVPFDAERMQAPHICLAVFGRGLLRHLYTRLYFPEEAANDGDPVLQCVPAERRATLIARRVSANGYRFDVALQGERETVFFDLR